MIFSFFFLLVLSDFCFSFSVLYYCFSEWDRLIEFSSCAGKSVGWNDSGGRFIDLCSDDCEEEEEKDGRECLLDRWLRGREEGMKEREVCV